MMQTDGGEERSWSAPKPTAHSATPVPANQSPPTPPPQPPPWVAISFLKLLLAPPAKEKGLCKSFIFSTKLGGKGKEPEPLCDAVRCSPTVIEA